MSGSTLERLTMCTISLTLAKPGEAMPGPYSSLMVLRRRASRSGAGRAVRGTKSGTRGGPPTEIIGLCLGPGPELKSVEFSFRWTINIYRDNIFFRISLCRCTFWERDCEETGGGDSPPMQHPREGLPSPKLCLSITPKPAAAQGALGAACRTAAARG